jgi:predicted molibdopterin-dependent oxidoreductase YjgC
MMTLTIDGQEVTVPHGTTVFDAARILGITIPTLCHQQNQTPSVPAASASAMSASAPLQAACVFKASPAWSSTPTPSPSRPSARRSMS